MLKITNWFKVFFFGSVFNSTLWYLYAMFWSWIVLYILLKTKRFHTAYFFVIPLLVLHVLGRSYITKYFNIAEYVFLFRSSVLFAIPLLLTGRYIAEKDIAQRNGIKAELMILIGLILIVVEYLIWHQYMDFHISTFFISVGLFVLALQHPRWNLVPFLSYIGKNLSKYIYIIHVPVKMVLYSLLIGLKLQDDRNNIFTVLVIVVTICFSYLIFSMKLLRLKYFKKY